MPVLIPTKRIARHCNPFRVDIWGTPVRQEDVRRALLERRLHSVPNVDDHAGRIAYLVENIAKDAIAIDVGVPILGHHVQWLIQDGNHRLAAAIYAGRQFILAEVDGQMDHASELFGVICD